MLSTSRARAYRMHSLLVPGRGHRFRTSNDGSSVLTFTRYTCHITRMTVLRLVMRPGRSIFEQVVFAAKKAIVSGEFLPGQPFPSIRTLAADLKIHPNTAHKVVQHLIQERFLESRPGIGTVVAELPMVRAADRRTLLQQEVEELVVEAMRMRIDLADVIRALEQQWGRLEKPAEAIR